MPKYQILLLVLVTSLFTSMIADAQSRGTPLDGIIAVVNEDAILRSELDRRITAVRDGMERQGNPVPPASVLRRQVLERLIIERIQLQRAEMMGLNMSEDMLNQAMNDIARSNGMTLEQFARALAEDGFDFAAVREEIRNDMIMQQVRQREVLSRLNVSQREVEAFLASQEAQSLDSREFSVSHILLRLDNEASAAEIERVRRLAEDLVARARAGEDFAELAITHSQGQQALEGGDLGWRRSTQLPAVFAERVVTMQPGQVADIIRTSGALHIIKLKDIRGQQERVVRNQTRARHIVLLPGPLMNEQRAMERLTAIRARLDAGEDFAELARRYSDDTASAVQGGDLGWISPGETVGPFEDKMDTMEPGQISQPFATQFGWHIVQVLERRAHDSTEEMRIARATQILRERKAEEAVDDWLRRLYDEAYIENRLDG